jgi:hypothetical protein
MVCCGGLRVVEGSVGVGRVSEGVVGSRILVMDFGDGRW